MTLGKPDAVKPPVRFDEGRSKTVIGIGPLNPYAPPTLPQTTPKPKQHTMKKTLAIISAAILLTGCASTSDNLSRETARTIGGLRSDQVTVSDVHRSMTSVSWVATTPSGVYDCEADDMVRRVNAVKRDNAAGMTNTNAVGADGSTPSKQ
jgi:hypothetical protein